jgi:transcriptional regulator with XRE-family HTH domain
MLNTYVYPFTPSPLRSLLGQRGMTLRTLAARTSIPITTLSRIQNNRRRLFPSEARRIANALGCTPDVLGSTDETRYDHTTPRKRLGTMGSVSTITATTFPKQSKYLFRRCTVSFHYDFDHGIPGVIVRDDKEEPYRTIIQIGEGRFILASECQYSFSKKD